MEAIFEIGSSNLSIINSTFVDNHNTLFLAENSVLSFNNSIISNHLCYTNIQGCVIFSNYETNLYIKNIKISDVSSSNKDNIYLQSTIALIDGLFMNNISASKQKGSCLGAIDSNIEMKTSFFQDFFWNCIYLEKSRIMAENIKLSNSLPHTFKFYGAFICNDCESSKIMNSLFEKNQNIYKGAALFINSNLKTQTSYMSQNLIKNCFFVENEAVEDGGGIFSENQYLIIENCTFAFNRAKRGGGIFNIIQGKTIKTF